jgi:hypothetical protein
MEEHKIVDSTELSEWLDSKVIDQLTIFGEYAKDLREKTKNIEND